MNLYERKRTVVFALIHDCHGARRRYIASTTKQSVRRFINLFNVGSRRDVLYRDVRFFFLFPVLRFVLELFDELRV